MDELMKCAVSDCRLRMAEGDAFLLPFDALRRINGGVRVPTAELGRFALCRHHNRQWRAENGGAQTMRLPDALRMSRNADERAASVRRERDERPVEARLMASLGERPAAPRTETERDERPPNRKPRRPRQSGPAVTKDGTRGAVAVGQGLAACSARDRAARQAEAVAAVPEAATAAKARNGRAPATATPAEAAL